MSIKVIKFIFNFFYFYVARIKKKHTFVKDNTTKKRIKVTTKNTASLKSKKQVL